MRMLTKAMIAIAMTGAAAVAVPGTGNAQGMYYYGHPGFAFGWGGPWGGPMYHGPYAWGGGSYAYARRDGRYRPYGPRARAYGQMHRWDPYGLRWDGSGQ
jgi:hypothetical protein